jgi:hypothetical protein
MRWTPERYEGFDLRCEFMDMRDVWRGPVLVTLLLSLPEIAWRQR